jgi:TonB-dependent starch-binding outer membrane protein SusC
MKRAACVIGALLAVLRTAPLGAQQPTGTVRGRVTNAATEQPLAGVSVTVGRRAAVTRADGGYVVNDIPVGSDTVRARLIGYAPATQAVTVAGGDTVTVDLAMTPRAVNLASVVVVGYGTQRAGDLTTSASQLSAEDFNTGTIVSPQQLVENKIPGVQVVDNNEPGGGLSIRVRGAASVTASSEPLYIVDGVPLGTGSGGGLSAGRDPLNFLNSNDVASITVLKDAASAAIYGTNASNGVVLITTKTGQGRTRVEYGSAVSAASVTRLPSMLNAAQFRAAVAQYDTAGLAQLGSATTDWFGMVDRTGMGQQHNVAVSGAGATNNYRLSVGYFDQNGILKGSATQRVSLAVNYDQRLYDDHLDVKADLKGSRAYDQFTPNGVLYNAAQMGPTQPVFDSTSATGFYNWPGNSLTSADNPVEVLNGALDHGTTYRSVGNLQARYDFSRVASLRGLTGTVNVGYDVTYADRVNFYPNNIHLETKNGTDGSYFRSQNTQVNTVLDAYADYAPPLSVGPGKLDFTGGYSYSQSHGNYPAIFANQLQSNLLRDAGIPQTATPPVPSFDVQDSKLISFFGRAGYNVDDRYLVSASIRRDGSSRFGAGNQWGNFPAVSVGWRISQEPFLRGVTAISDLKLRASWGKTGNQAFSNYLYVPTYQFCNSQAQVQFGSQFVCPARPSGVDPNIKWESTRTWDAGADFTLFGQRLAGSFDWYTKHTDDLLFDEIAAAGQFLSNFVTRNIGSVKNTGFDLGLTARLRGPSPTGGLSWTTSLNVSHNTNALVTINPNANGVTGSRILTGGIAGGVGSTVQVLEPGQPINSFFVCQQVYNAGTPVEGMYKTLAGADTTACARGTNTRAFHDPAPHWMFGFTSDMAYRHFDLSFTLRAWLGNYVYNNVASNLGDYRELRDGSSPYNLSTSVLATGFKTQQLLSDYYVENGSFLRMDNIALGYTFPWQAQQLRVYVNVQSAFTITGYSGVDPTAGVNGIDNNIYPRSRIVTGGLNVQF